MTKSHCVLDAERIERILTRITHEILERNKRPDALVLVAIRRGGEWVGRRIAEKLRAIESTTIPLGFLDITLYRDDLSRITDYPLVRKTEIPFAIEGKDVILIDDVLYTGRTIRAALEGITAFGRPRTIQLAVLIDRGHRELPIRADYVGRNLPTGRRDRVEVTLTADRTGDCVEIVGDDPADAREE
jgi:pyrimidine operon attenuation protein/uracil phosphoribosyltransferase